MKAFLCVTLLVLTFAASGAEPGKKVSLFDGKTLKGWEGNTKMWRVKEGAIVGGSLEETVPHNEFLCTTRQFTNFVLRFKFKLLGTEGFVNSGMQIRSQRVPNHHEVSGYQADIGPGWWGTLYDEARRNKILIKADPKVEKAVKPQDWNDYEIRADGKRIQLFINGVQSVDYTEPDDSIPQFGILGIQIHGGGKGLIHVKDITIEELK